jgi:hypothetical protein
MQYTTSERRIEANRANAAKSHGPMTPEGKARSSRNAVRHGLSTTAFIVANEDLDEYTAMRRDFAARFGPRDHVEACLVDRKVRATWNLMRSWEMENESLNLQMFRMEGALATEYEDVQEHSRLALAAEEKHKQPGFNTLTRYQAHQSMEYQRAYKMLLDTRKNFPLAPDGPLQPVVFEPCVSREKSDGTNPTPAEPLNASPGMDQPSTQATQPTLLTPTAAELTTDHLPPATDHFLQERTQRNARTIVRTTTVKTT